MARAAKQAQPSATTTWWLAPDIPRDGFTALCRARFGEFETMDFAESIRLLQARADLIATAMAVKQARQTSALRRAVLVSNN